jgi:hydroxyacylglutathione hydrolase
MYIKQLYTNCLAQAAYYIESDGEAAVIDPMREPDPYLSLAKERGATIKYVFETHFHADFVSGHLEVARRTNAVIVYGPGAKPGYKATIALDNQVFSLGKIQIRVLHTPGHTIESSCFLVEDETGKQQCVFTGDTLFVGEVGRPDLLSGNLTKEELGGMLYDSLNNKIKTLPDHLVVYPGHGPGSACGKNIGKETVSTMGEQKRSNYALQSMSKQEFIEAVTSSLPVPPKYFFKDASINISGYDSTELLPDDARRALNVSVFQNEIEKGAIILDTRTASDFSKEFIPGSVNIGLNGDFAIWAGTLIEFGKPIVLVCQQGTEAEAVMRLSRIGYESVKGYLCNGIQAWREKGLPTESILSLEYMNAMELAAKQHVITLDVRRPGENESLQIDNAIRIPLSDLQDYLKQLDKNNYYLVYCAGGYRSMIAASILRKNGFKNVIDLKGGINACKLLLT